MRYSLLSAAVTTTVGGVVVHLGGTVDTRRYSTGELIRAAQSRAYPFVFIIVFILASARPASLSVGRLYVIYITNVRRKTGEKPTE